MIKLQDEQWQELEPFLLGKQGDPGANAKNNRLFIEAVLWIVSRNSAWRHLPREFGNWTAAYMRFRRWNECDFWRQLTQSEVRDPALLQLLERIVDYGDLYTRRIEQRQERRICRTVYEATLAPADGAQAVKQLALSPSESILHWVHLVAPR
ncbi:transposase [Collimonas silvisoli]|uniref:transposase n=1 Tax=Collimonas silvisoli TaxID=2825884 RepID=UPI001B8D3AAA|nr:transposase [Collimonas silvisoli]